MKQAVWVVERTAEEEGGHATHERRPSNRGDNRKTRLVTSISLALERFLAYKGEGYVVGHGHGHGHDDQCEPRNESAISATRGF
jgi:hypothetical protein